MKVLVTGGAGFIGSHLVEKLLEEGHEVWTLDNFFSGKEEFINHLLENKHHHFIKGSVLDRSILGKVISQTEIIYHLAAVLGVKNTVDNPLMVIEENITGTKNVLELAFKERKKVIFASTSEVYGKNENIPFKEDDNRVLGSTAVHRWSYSTSKALDEHLCLAYYKNGLPVTILRYFNAYGPRATATAYGGVIPRFITAALNNEPLYVYGTGEQLRCFTYIKDTVEGTYRAMSDKADGMVINIGNDQMISIFELAHLIKELTASKSNIEKISYEQAYGKGYEDMLTRQPDLSKMRDILNFTPQVSLKAGLLETIEWFKTRSDV